MFWLFLLFFCFALPRPVSAQVPLWHQLVAAFKPASYNSISLGQPQANTQSQLVALSPNPNNSIWSNKPLTGQVLGVNDSQPAVGGMGKVITIAMFGDSMIDTLQSDLPQLQSALKNYYPNVKFNLLNYGYGGSNLEYAIHRLENNHSYLGRPVDSLISQQPDIIVLESFAYNNYGNSQTGIDKHWKELSEITSKIKEKLPNTKIVLAATIAPNSIVFGNGIKDVSFTSMEKIEKSSTIKLYLQNMVNFATSQHFPLADAYHGSLSNNEGIVSYISGTDGLHPSGSGGQFFCNTVAKTIFDNNLI